MKTFNLIMILTLIVITGCVRNAELGKGSTSYNTYFPPRDQSYLKDVLSTSFYVSENQQFEVNFVVVNPVLQPTELIVELRYDLTECFVGINRKTLSIQANSDISSGISVTIPRLTNPKCIGTRTISVVLMDESNRIIDFSNMLVNIKTQ